MATLAAFIGALAVLAAGWALTGGGRPLFVMLKRSRGACAAIYAGLLLLFFDLEGGFWPELCKLRCDWD